jgi:hypothetical protein
MINADSHSHRTHTAEERATRKSRVAAAKTALRDSSRLPGAHVPAARSALKSYLRDLNGPNQPSDAVFQIMLAAPFALPRRARD